MRRGRGSERRDSLVNDTASDQLKHLLLLGLLVEHTVEPDGEDKEEGREEEERGSVGEWKEEEEE